MCGCAVKISYRENPWFDREKTSYDRERTVNFVKLIFCIFLQILHGPPYELWCDHMFKDVYLWYYAKKQLCATSAVWQKLDRHIGFDPCYPGPGRVFGTMVSLQNLPFPLEELSWDKLSVVQKHLKLSKAETVTILHHVLGPRPEVTHLILKYFQILDLLLHTKPWVVISILYYI